ncbi:hypothetical protein O181_066004 [Austropuccinia psidii MF-1]|uniref:Uncharacterized protein n=1 Tax=Austropuccinia psidii MF-1 TaxID=1389203 RepID=A0A9Q3ES58_9BASI|nr:hypothetical protein [Austropuccinia psidii MF-1]
MRPTTKPQVDPPEPFWPPISSVPKMAIRTPGPKLAIFNPWPLATTRGHQLKLSKLSPPLRGKTLRTKDSGMVHIWYNIPLCTNGEGFRTSLCHFKSSPQIHHPF